MDLNDRPTCMATPLVSSRALVCASSTASVVHVSRVAKVTRPGLEPGTNSP